MKLKEHCGLEEAHTPHLHFSHKKSCGCSTDREADFAVCKCGAAYTYDVLSFHYFRCYDCGRYNYTVVNYNANFALKQPE